MSILHTGRFMRSLLILTIATPWLLTSAGSDRSRAPKENEQPESPQVSSIVYRVIANEWQIRSKLQAYSPRVET
jgi:hypothetical protein